MTQTNSAGTNRSSNHFFSILFQNYYSTLTDRISKIQKNITENHFDDLDLIFSLITHEIEIMILHEKSVLARNKTIVELKKSIAMNSKLLRDLKLHFQSILSNVNQFKKQLKYKVSETEAIRDLNFSIIEFETDLLQIQKAKCHIFCDNN